jgi:hypothetical protein
MIRHIVTPIAALFGLCSSNLATAATITIASQGPPAWVHVVGTFEYADGKRFEATTSAVQSAIVVFQSDGGNAQAGIDIGRTIRAKKFTTLAWHECASACGVAWLGGAKRMMFIDTHLGCHAAYRRGDGSESGAANAVVGGYLRELGLSDDAIYFLTEAPPRSMNWLTLADARKYSIDVELVPPSASLVLPSASQPQFASVPNTATTFQPAPVPAVTADPPPQRFVPFLRSR